VTLDSADRTGSQRVTGSFDPREARASRARSRRVEGGNCGKEVSILNPPRKMRSNPAPAQQRPARGTRNPVRGGSTPLTGLRGIRVFWEKSWGSRNRRQRITTVIRCRPKGRQTGQKKGWDIIESVAETTTPLAS